MHFESHKLITTHMQLKMQIDLKKEQKVNLLFFTLIRWMCTTFLLRSIIWSLIFKRMTNKIRNLKIR